MDITKFLVLPNSRLNLSRTSTDETERLKTKKTSLKLLKKNVETMSELQSKLYAQDKYSLLIIFQAMDAAGKDGVIKHVMSGLNPQGTQVFSFKQPSAEELDHGYLWRIHKAMPERGKIGIFNRSHYEEVLVVRVHDLLKYQKVPEKFKNKNIWKQRYRQINDFERYLYENGIIIIKFFLHISKEEQKRRFLQRIEDPERNWKFSNSDIKERSFWDEYQKAYQQAISATSRKYAPWYIVPADTKWFARFVVSEVIIKHMRKLKPRYPVLDKRQFEDLKLAEEILLSEKN